MSYPAVLLAIAAATLSVLAITTPVQAPHQALGSRAPYEMARVQVPADIQQFFNEMGARISVVNQDVLIHADQVIDLEDYGGYVEALFAFLPITQVLLITPRQWGELTRNRDGYISTAVTTYKYDQF